MTVSMTGDGASATAVAVGDRTMTLLSPPWRVMLPAITGNLKVLAAAAQSGHGSRSAPASNSCPHSEQDGLGIRHAPDVDRDGDTSVGAGGNGRRGPNIRSRSGH